MLVDDDLLAARVADARRGSFYARHLAGKNCVTRADFQNLPTSSVRDLGPDGLSELHSPTPQADELGNAAAFLSGFAPDLDAQPLMEAILGGSLAAKASAGLAGMGPGSVPEIRCWRSETLLEVARGLIDLQPSAIAAEPRALLLLAEAAQVSGAPGVPSSVDTVLADGLLPSSLGARLESDWGARVVEWYRRPEALVLGASCAEGSLHLANDLYSCEILDPVRGEAVPPGERGVLVITSLEPTSYPLVRWSTGDLLEVGTSVCKCKRPDFPVRRLGPAADSIMIGGRASTPVEILSASQTFATALDSRIFHTGVRTQDIRILVEVAETSAALPTKDYLELRRQIGLPMDVGFVARGSDLGSLLLDEIDDASAGQLWHLADWAPRERSSSRGGEPSSGSFFSADRWRAYRQERQRRSRRRSLWRMMKSQEPL